MLYSNLLVVILSCQWGQKQACQKNIGLHIADSIYFSSNFKAFLAHLAKGKVSFCHHLASVVCRPLTFHILIFSSETPQPND
jgi:hypothetical protein